MLPSYKTVGPSAPNIASSAYHSDVPHGWMQQSITIRGGISDGALKVLAKLQSFRRLSENWDSYEAVRPSMRAIDQAIDLVQSLDQAGQAIYFVAPGPNGEIVVELKGEERSVEVYFNGDGTAECVVFQGSEVIQESDSVPGIYALVAALG